MNWYESDPKSCGIPLCSSPCIKLSFMYSISAKIYKSEVVWCQFFAPRSFLKSKVAVSESGSIFHVAHGDFNRSVRRLFSSQLESPAGVP